MYDIIINPRKVYETGMKYHNYSDSIKMEQAKLIKIKEDIENSWTGVDIHNFQVSFENHIYLLDSIVDFLEEKSFILKENAQNHNVSDDNLKISMERSDMNEQFKYRF